MNLYLRILRYVRPHAGLFVLGVVCMAISAGLDALAYAMLTPFLNVLFKGDTQTVLTPAEVLRTGEGYTGQILERVLGWFLQAGSPMEALRQVVVALFFIFLLKNIFLYAKEISISVVEGRVTRDLRNDVYTHLIRLGFPFFQRTRAGQIISRVTGDVDTMRTLVTGNISKLLSSIAEALAVLYLLVGISWKLTLVALLVLPPMLGLWGRFRKRLRRGVLKVLNAVGEVASQIQETVAGVRLVKASGAEGWEERRFRALTQRHYKALVRNERWRKFFGPATEMITAVGILGIIWYGSFLVLEEGSLTGPAFVTALVLAGKLMSPIKFIAQFPSVVQPGLAAGERVFELVDAPIEVRDHPDALPVSAFRNAIRFEGVDFAYTADAPVLSGVELEIRRGQVVALVGPSGAGKSTLADLLPRFHDPVAGRITLDGKDIRALRLAELRGLLGIVTQETILFHDTVRANIAYGMANPDAARVEAAARAANAHEFIAAMPQGYDTVLGEKGTRLSGGQRQRIAIARALFRDPPVLILDEATSALDTESERLVQQAIDEVMEGRTVLVIAHRLSTVRRADQIVAMEGGRVVERGSHDELLARDGLYRRLHDLQFAADAPARPSADVEDEDDQPPRSEIDVADDVRLDTGLDAA